MTPAAPDTTMPAEDAEAHVARLIAGFQKAGHAVHRLADGGFLVCKWSMSRSCPDARALAEFGRMCGVRG